MGQVCGDAFARVLTIFVAPRSVWGYVVSYVKANCE